MAPGNSPSDFDPPFMTARYVARPALRQRFVGVLWPEVGFAPPASIQLDKEEWVIGRLSDVDLPLEDEQVSRRHARIRRVDDEFVLEDLESSNGTYVDGVPVLSCVLRPGDWIQIGRTVLRFEVRLAAATGIRETKTCLE